MPPKLWRNLQTLMGTVRSVAAERAQALWSGAVDFAEPAAQASMDAHDMTLADLGMNFAIGADPSFGYATRNVEPGVSSFPLQVAGSLLVPGVPGSPIFNKADDLIRALRKMPTDRLADRKTNFASSMRDALFGERSVVRPSHSGSAVESRSMIELDVMNDAADQVLLERALRGGYPTAHYLARMDYVEDYGRAVDPTGFADYIQNRLNTIDGRIQRNDSFLQLLDDIAPRASGAQQ